MTNRLILGNRSGQYGLWISKPGIDVLTASDRDCLFSSDVRAFQVVQSGDLGDIGSGGSVGIATVDQGFLPFVVISCMKYRIQVSYSSNAFFTIASFGERTTTFGAAILDGSCKYAVVNQGLH
jgi:hypothetical protein